MTETQIAPNLSVVLVRPRNPLNIGAAARAMSNFGFFDLRLVEPYEVAFREARSAVGALPLLQAAQIFETVAEAVAGSHLVVGTTSGERREPEQPLHRLEMGASLMRAQAGKIALLFGSEKYGLSNDDMSHCHFLIRIPSRPEHSSMNLGQAVAVCLYELVRCQPGANFAASRRVPAPSEHVEALVEHLYAVLLACGYYAGTNTAGALRRLRNVVKRLAISKHDAPLILGMLRQIQWRLKQQERQDDHGRGSL
ncbi:MAG: TrmJ/YjtD family RNA methyltransferase [Bryobacteraceae bacterium]|nr:TrmJ/YjtD family RNA methyltransferase [Bryobacteraceae bacterium]MDW8379754.1 TrmJ/YjtD family RNA methyltransferase [Bryobacterales bacterium]